MNTITPRIQSLQEKLQLSSFTSPPKTDVTIIPSGLVKKTQAVFIESINEKFDDEDAKSRDFHDSVGFRKKSTPEHKSHLSALAEPKKFTPIFLLTPHQQTKLGTQLVEISQKEPIDLGMFKKLCRVEKIYLTVHEMFSLLRAACVQSSLGLFEWIKDNSSILPTAVDDYGNNSLHQAAINPFFYGFTELLKNSSINAQALNGEGKTPLTLFIEHFELPDACNYDDLSRKKVYENLWKISKKLIGRYGAHLQEQDKIHFWRLSCISENIEWIQELLDQKIFPQTTTPLHFLIQISCANTFSQILEKCPPDLLLEWIQAKGLNSCSVLYDLCIQDRVHKDLESAFFMIEALLQKGADPNFGNTHQNCLEALCLNFWKSPHQEVPPKLLKLLLLKGASYKSILQFYKQVDFKEAIELKVPSPSPKKRALSLKITSKAHLRKEKVPKTYSILKKFYKTSKKTRHTLH